MTLLYWGKQIKTVTSENKELGCDIREKRKKLIFKGNVRLLII